MAACAGPVVDEAGADPTHVSADTATTPRPTGRFGSHGMVLFGGERTFLSHIPMTHSPHDVQLVLEIMITSSPVTLPAFDSKLYTFVPSPLSLDALRLGRLVDLVGSVFLGNFEDGGRLLASGVRAHVKRIVFQEVLDAHATAVVQPTYLVMGAAHDAYAVHLLGTNAAHGFDHIAHVELTDPSLVMHLGDATAPRMTLAGTDDLTHARAGLGASANTLSCLVGPDYAAPCAD